MLFKKTAPVYPEAARHTDHEGVSYVEFIIDKHGVPREPAIVKSCGVVGFDVAVMEATRAWRFRPARLYGEPVAVYYTLTVTFTLER